MRDLRGGLIGCGFFAHNQMHGWKEVNGAEIAAVCDTDAERAEGFAREFGATAYTDAERMLREASLDFVDVVTQPGSHRPLVELAAAHRLPVICQKPLAASLEDARAMVAACERAGIPFMVHENFRWQPAMRALKQVSQESGALFFGRVQFRSGYDPYVNQPYLAEDPRFIIADLGVHLLDLARFFFGEAASLTCHTQRVNPCIKGEDVATILLKMQSGAVCLVDMSYASKTTFDPFPQTFIAMEGAQGRAELGPRFRITKDDGNSVTGFGVEAPRYSWSEAPFEAIQASVVAIQQHWADCLRDGRAPETSGADNLKTLELVYGSYESAETDKPTILKAGD